MILSIMCGLINGCNGLVTPIGIWKSSVYPRSPAMPPYFLEIRENGEYSYSTVPGHGIWTIHDNTITLKRYGGVNEESFNLENEPKMLRNIYTDGVDFLPAEP